MKTNRNIRRISMLLAIMLIVSCAAPAPSARAESAGTHSIVEKTYPFYIGSMAEDTLNQEFPVAFIDGADDLPYVEITEWAKLLYFIQAELKEDTDYDLSIEHGDGTVVLERENGYTLTLDYANDKLIFLDYDAFVHNSNDTTLIDLVSEAGTDENGNAELIWRDKDASFNRYGDVMTVDLGAYGIHLIAQDDKLYVPL